MMCNESEAGKDNTHEFASAFQCAKIIIANSEIEDLVIGSNNPIRTGI